jgi:carbon-monoxide dehydrogenase large subunit
MTPATDKFVGRSVLRREDRRLLIGRGQFIGDIVLPHMLHAAMVRSQIAHGRIKSIDKSQALNSPGVEFVLTGEDLRAMLPANSDMPALHSIPMINKWVQQTQHKVNDIREPVLTTGKVMHVGQVIAVVIASSRYEAEDAADLIRVEYEPIPAVVDIEAALAPDSPIVHEEHPTNLAAEFSISKGNVEAAMSKAPHRLKRRFYSHRYGAVPMECRGMVASYDERTESLTAWATSQTVHALQREIAQMLRLPEAKVRVIAPDVGGGFGPKGHAYPEDMLIPFLARKLGRPIQWLEDRREHFVSTCHARDQVHDVEVGFDDEGRILALRDDFRRDMGAFHRINVGIPYNSAVHLLGPYKVENVAITHKSIVTNKVPNAPYRGAGRPEAALAMERTLDVIAQTLGIDPIEVRRRNMIGAEEMPYRLGFHYRDGVPIVYDSGDYPALFEQAVNAIGGLDVFRKRQKLARAEGRYLGLGMGSYVEGTGVGPFEGATVRLDSSGKICVIGGACAQGQGMETIYSQVAADFWGVDPKDVLVTLGDSGAIHFGFGTNSSRSTVTLGGAVHMASVRLRQKVFELSAHLLECSPADLELRDGSVGVVGVPGARVPLTTVARHGRPGWNHARPSGMEGGLEETVYFEPATVTWTAAVHAAVVEIDIKIGQVRIDKYVIAHDCGVVINPMLIEGQIIGGAAQGLGGVLLEEFNYDAEGQLLTGSLMDYLLPTAMDIPEIELLHMCSPSPLNPLGVKGVGEGGAIGPPAAIASAVSDALAEYGLECNSTPIKPEEIVMAIRRHTRAQAKPAS